MMMTKLAVQLMCLIVAQLALCDARPVRSAPPIANYANPLIDKFYCEISSLKTRVDLTLHNNVTVRSKPIVALSLNLNIIIV